MSFLAIGAAAFAIGCGSSDDQASKQAAPADQAAVSQTDQSGTPASSSTESAKKAADKTSKSTAKAAEKTSPKAAAKAHKAEIKALHKQALAKQKKIRKNLVQARRQQQKKVDEAYAKVRANVKKARAEIGDLKVGTSKIPAAVNQACAARLREVDGAIHGGSKAKALPGVLSATIAEVEKLSSKDSPVARGTTGDLAGRSRASAVLDAMRATVTPAKRFASGGPSTDLSSALKKLSQTAQFNQLSSCRVA
jgi:hypothetical protein